MVSVIWLHHVGPPQVARKAKIRKYFPSGGAIFETSFPKVLFSIRKDALSDQEMLLFTIIGRTLAWRPTGKARNNSETSKKYSRGCPINLPRPPYGGHKIQTSELFEYIWTYSGVSRYIRTHSAYSSGHVRTMFRHANIFEHIRTLFGHIQTIFGPSGGGRVHV